MATAGLPFTAAELDATLLGAGHGRMLPRAAYTSERVLAFELSSTGQVAPLRALTGLGHRR